MISPVNYPDVVEFKKDARFIKISNFNELQRLYTVELASKKRKTTGAAELITKSLNSVDVK